VNASYNVLGAGGVFDVSYAKGDTKNVIATSGTSPSFAMFGDSGFAYQSVGFGATTDGVYLPGVGGTGGIKLTTAWGLRGAFNHNWDPYWSTSLYGSYSSVRYDGGANDNLLGAGTTTAKGAYCAAFAASHPGQALVGKLASGQDRGGITRAAKRRKRTSCCPRDLRAGVKPIPRQQFVEFLDGMFGDAGQDVGEPGLRVDVIHLGRDDQAVHNGGALASAI
jgi:hypothetical protein